MTGNNSTNTVGGVRVISRRPTRRAAAPRALRVGVFLILLLLSGCTASGAGNTIVGAPPINPASATPVTINVWSFFTGREQQVFEQALAKIHTRYPWLTLKNTPGKLDTDLLRAVNGGQPPDLSLLLGPPNLGNFCHNGTVQDLTPLVRQDGLALDKVFPPQATQYGKYDGKLCALPLLTDAYGLYYNKDLLATAGYSKPPRTLSELSAMARKLTTFNSDGSIKTAGFIPLSTFYETPHALQGNYFGASWYQGTRSTLGSDPAWVAGLRWQKKLVDDLGYGKLQAFTAAIGADSEFGVKNAFETGRVAMMIDGEWRVAFIKADKSAVNYATAPFPVFDTQPQLYGSGQIGGTLIGIPRGAQHPAAAWVAMRALTTDTGILNGLADELQNVPTTYAALKTSKQTADPHSATFLKILTHPQSRWKQPASLGAADMDKLMAFIGKWESGQVPDLPAGLRSVATDIDNQSELE